MSVGIREAMLQAAARAFVKAEAEVEELRFGEMTPGRTAQYRAARDELAEACEVLIESALACVKAVRADAKAVLEDPANEPFLAPEPEEKKSRKPRKPREPKASMRMVAVEANGTSEVLDAAMGAAGAAMAGGGEGEDEDRP